MTKLFNTTGTCIPEKHFLVDISGKLKSIFQYIEKGNYFSINRPRQYGKTTTLFLLLRFLADKPDYFPIKLSFEGMDPGQFENAKNFCLSFTQKLQKFLMAKGHPPLAKWIEQHSTIDNFDQFDSMISDFIIQVGKKVVLLIDEVDQSGNHPLFLSFLGLLRRKYLLRAEGDDITFHSVILTGVHDVKNLKLKLRSPEEQQYNSPWNIATNFEVEMSFSTSEIESMLQGYKNERQVVLDSSNMAKQLYYYTSGHPFLVSMLCKTMDEKLMEADQWELPLLESAIQRLLQENNPNFESVIKNLENHENLYRLTHDCLIMGADLGFNYDHPETQLGVIYGIFKNDGGKLKIHNRIYEQRIYNYLISKIELTDFQNHYSSQQFLKPDGTLNFEKILLKFQEFMREQYSDKDTSFLERNGRLVFLAFLKPIINGKGFDFKEVEISEERRLDVTVTYLNQKFVVELKLWRGPTAHQKGIEQLASYLERVGLTQGYLLIFDQTKRTAKPHRQEHVTHRSKGIFIVWV